VSSAGRMQTKRREHVLPMRKNPRECRCPKGFLRSGGGISTQNSHTTAHRTRHRLHTRYATFSDPKRVAVSRPERTRNQRRDPSHWAADAAIKPRPSGYAPDELPDCSAPSWRSPASRITANASRTCSVVELRRSGRHVMPRHDCLASPLVEATDQRVHFVGNRAGFDDSNRRTKRQSDHRHDEGIEFVGSESNRARVGSGVDGRVVDP